MRHGTLTLGVAALALAMLGAGIAPRTAQAQDHDRGRSDREDHGRGHGARENHARDRGARRDRAPDRRAQEDRRGPRIGLRIATIPRDHDRVFVRGRPYVVRGGVFYEQGPRGYVVVVAPLGAELRALPPYASVVRMGRMRYWYFHGAFYQWDGPRRVYVVVAPPPGAEVSYVPDGYSEEREGGATLYIVGGARYRPVVRGGITMYIVVH